MRAASALAACLLLASCRTAPETARGEAYRSGAADEVKRLYWAKQALEARIQRRLDAITPALVVQLGKIFNSIKDGMSSPGEWFDIAPSPDDDSAADRAQQIKDRLRANGGNGPAAAVPTACWSGTSRPDAWSPGWRSNTESGFLPDAGLHPKPPCSKSTSGYVLFV